MYVSAEFLRGYTYGAPMSEYPPELEGIVVTLEERRKDRKSGQSTEQKYVGVNPDGVPEYPVRNRLIEISEDDMYFLVTSGIMTALLVGSIPPRNVFSATVTELSARGHFRVVADQAPEEEK
jgi:hypothetical protein